MLLQPGSRPVPNCPDYILVSKRGAGAFGQVWHARGPGGLDVALKFIRLDAQVFALELRSLEVMKKIRHPNLVSLFGAWHKDDWLILAMELCDGTLLDRLAEALDEDLPGIPLEELLTYMTDAANGLDALNAKQVQHRDVKPANLLLLDSGVKVADFGLAKALEQTVASNSGAGTIAYLAPECFKGQITQQSDQYSLAVTYYHLRTGRLPFKGDQAQMIYAHLEVEPDLTAFPPAERTVLARALAKEPSERWPSCKGFVKELTKVQQEMARQAAERRKRAEEQKRAIERQRQEAQAAEQKRENRRQRAVTDNSAIATTTVDFLSALHFPLLTPEQQAQLPALVEEFPEIEALAAELVGRAWLTRFQIEQLVAGKGQQLILGNYILLDFLGQGDMGIVYRVRHSRMKRNLALKIARKDLADDSTAMQCFRLEIAAFAQFSHPNVVMAYDANEVDDSLFLVMEHVEGIDLAKFVQKYGKVPVGDATDYIRQAALGLQHIHERGVVHRDINPSNLLLANNGVVKICDMGFARLPERRDGKQLLATGMVMGTPDFVSPEQAQDLCLADIRSDLYSLGCTLYYLLAGKTPFPNRTSTEKLLAHALDPVPDLCQQNPDVPEPLGAIIFKLMAKKPGDRLQTPIAVAQALEPFAVPSRCAQPLSR
jgi:serine/threonine protein kinase